ncbi:hypothetical protein [Streptomyces sp. GSL17-111]|uniref:hypothetical protein n=1 Tax=Streptomyces sp. GSL17-111 TaxID=3121596 RepID=UPI0030F3A2F9
MKELTRGQVAVLVAAGVPMVAAGVAGGIGTYTNIVTAFGRAATAVGVVAAGEGVTLILALVMVGLTMLGQTAPAPVRAGLWLAPMAASATSIAVADGFTEAVVYGMTPLAMSAAAEGLGLLARRVWVYRTGVDMEARRKNAATVQRLAYHRARAQSHPTSFVRWRSERVAWRLAAKVGHGDVALADELVEVQRARLVEGADAALADMLGNPTDVGVSPAAGALPSTPDVEELPAASEGGAPADTPAAPVRVDVERVPVVGPFWHDDEPPALPVPRPVLAAAEPRTVVTEPVTDEPTPGQLRQAARRLNTAAVKATGRPVTITRLREELSLSRRDATELRRQIVTKGKTT